MIRSDAGRCPVSAQCGILGVAKSTCYWVLEHPEAERADPYEKDVERVWRDSGKVYGARKIRHALEHEGVTLSRRRVNRIMKGNGMAGSCSKAAYRPRPARPDDDPAPDILAREFNGYAPRTHLACISSSRCFVFSHVFFSGLGSCMHFPYFSGCAEVFLPNMRASLTRRLWPVNSRSRPWCTMRSMIAAASLSSAKTVPHLLNSMFVVNMMLRLS